jgi:hypothetical protein
MEPEFSFSRSQNPTLVPNLSQVNQTASISSRFIVILSSYLHLDLQNDILAYLLKARTVEPEKESLLGNGSEHSFLGNGRETTPVARQQILNKQEWTVATREQLGK